MQQETTEDDEKTAESPQPAVGSLGDDVVPKRSTTATSAAAFPTDSKPTMGGGTARKRGRPRKNVAEATATTTKDIGTQGRYTVEKPSVAVDALFFAGLNGTLKLMVQQERQHKLSRLAIV